MTQTGTLDCKEIKTIQNSEHAYVVLAFPGFSKENLFQIQWQESL